MLFRSGLAQGSPANHPAPTVPAGRAALGADCPRTAQTFRGELAERPGFEPGVEFPPHTLSRRAPSATRTPLRTPGVHQSVSRFSDSPARFGFSHLGVPARHEEPLVAASRRGGEGGIRTHVGVAPQPAFEAGPLRPLRYLSRRRPTENPIADNRPASESELAKLVLSKFHFRYTAS